MCAGIRPLCVSISSEAADASVASDAYSHTAAESLSSAHVGAAHPAVPPAISESAFVEAHYEAQNLALMYEATLQQVARKRDVALAIKAQREIDRRVPPLDAYFKTVLLDPILQNVADPMAVAIQRRCEEWKQVREEMRVEWSMPHLLFTDPVLGWSSLHL